MDATWEKNFVKWSDENVIFRFLFDQKNFCSAISIYNQSTREQEDDEEEEKKTNTDVNIFYGYEFNPFVCDKAVKISDEMAVVEVYW